MRIWQTIIGLLIFTALLLTVASLTFGSDGDFGFRLRSNGDALTILSVTPGSSAAAAGLRAGDVIYIGDSFHDRVVAFATRPGDRSTYNVGTRNGRTVTLVAGTAAIAPALIVILIATRVSFLLVSGVVAWRRPDDDAARALATFLACYGAALGMDIALTVAIVPRYLAALAQETLYLVGTAAVLAFACRFPARATSGPRRALERAIVPVVALGLFLSSVRNSLTVIAGNRTLSHPLFDASAILLIAMLVAAFVALASSYRIAVGAQRARMLWILATLVFGLSGIAGELVADTLGNADSFQYLALTVVAIPLGLSYVILRHRVLDIGFVVNRAVVYAVVSLIVVGAFISVEWLVSRIVVERQSSTSILLQLGAALTLGVSVRFIHARVDKHVDDLFFRERHAAEAAIRRFAHEAALVTNPEDLVIKTVEVAQRNARLTGVAFYARRDGRYVPLHSTITDARTIDENDYAVLEMRTWHRHADIDQARSAITGEIAFPMMVRGALAGFLVCAHKATHEAMAPDERDALAVLARDSGIALDSLRVRLIERELTLLSEDGELSATVRSRLARLVAAD